MKIFNYEWCLFQQKIRHFLAILVFLMLLLAFKSMTSNRLYDVLFDHNFYLFFFYPLYSLSILFLIKIDSRSLVVFRNRNKLLHATFLKITMITSVMFASFLVATFLYLWKTKRFSSFFQSGTSSVVYTSLGLLFLGIVLYGVFLNFLIVTTENRTLSFIIGYTYLMLDLLLLYRDPTLYYFSVWNKIVLMTAEKGIRLATIFDFLTLIAYLLILLAMNYFVLSKKDFCS